MSSIDDIKKKIKEKLEETSYPVKPKSFGKKYDFPEDLTQLLPERIGQIMAMLAAYRGYVVRQLGLSQINRNLLTSNLSFELMEKMSKVIDWKDTKTALKEKITLEQKEARDSLLMAEQMCLLYETLLRVYDGQLEVLSREISRRKNEL